MRSHSTRKDRTPLGTQRIQRMSEQASKIVDRLSKASKKRHVTKELGINAAADRTLEKLTEEEPIISAVNKGENPPMVRKLAPHWAKYFQQLDTQRSGYISYEDFSNALLTVASPSKSIYWQSATQERDPASLGHATYEGPLVGKKEAYQLAKLLDRDKSGLINYHNLVPSLARAVRETKLEAEEKAIKRLATLDMSKLTSPLVSSGSSSTVSDAFEHVPKLYSQSDIGASQTQAQMDYQNHGRFSHRRTDSGNLSIAGGMVTISDAPNSFKTHQELLDMNTFHRFKKPIGVAQEEKNIAQRMHDNNVVDSAPLQCGRIASELRARPRSKSADGSKQAHIDYHHTDTNHLGALISHEYLESSGEGNSDLVTGSTSTGGATTLGQRAHYIHNRHTNFVTQFEGARRSKKFGNSSSSLAEVYSGMTTLEPESKKSIRRSSSAPPTRSKAMTLGKYQANDKENEVNNTLTVDVDVGPADEEAMLSLKTMLSSSSTQSPRKVSATTDTGAFSPLSIKQDHHRYHLHKRSNSNEYNRMKGSGTADRNQDARAHANNIHVGNSIVTQLSSGKRLSSLRHALKKYDGSHSGSVAYSEFKEAIVNNLGLKIPDAELKEFYNANASCRDFTSNASNCAASTTAGDIREKLVNIDDFICNMQCRASSKLFGLHKNSTISTPTNSTLHAKISRESEEEIEYSAVTVEEERVIKKVLHASNKMQTTDPMKLFNDLSAHHETDVGAYNDPCRLIPTVTVSQFKDGLSYMGASLSDGEFYTLANALTHHHADGTSSKGSGLAELTGTGLDKSDIRINVKEAFDTMQKTAVLADQYNRKHKYDAMIHNPSRSVRYTKTFKSDESIIDHYAHHLRKPDKPQRSSVLDVPSSTEIDSATHITGEFDGVRESKTLKSNRLMWQKLKYAIQDKKESLLGAFESVELKDPNGEANDPTQKALPWKTLRQELNKNGIFLGTDDFVQLEHKLLQHKKMEHVDAGPVLETGGSVNDTIKDSVLVTLADVCKVAEIPLTVDPNHRDKAVAHHPLEAYNNVDGNIFATSTISATRGGACLENNSRLCTNDSLASSYMLDKEISGEETTIYVKGNRKK